MTPDHKAQAKFSLEQQIAELEKLIAERNRKIKFMQNENLADGELSTALNAALAIFKAVK